MNGSWSGRIRSSDRIRRSGFHAPAAPRPVVTWRVPACRDRLLRVFLGPEGWRLLTDRFSVPLQDWMTRVDPLGTAAEDTVWVNARKVAGIERLLPPDLNSWPTDGRFELGCKHVHGWGDLDGLRVDCQKVADTRKPVDRSFAPIGG